MTTVANSEGVILPREARDRLDVKKGDTVFPTEAPDGSYRLTPYSPDFERQMALAKTIMDEDRDILRALAE